MIGLCNLLLVAPNHQYILGDVPVYFKILLKLVKANCKSRTESLFEEKQYEATLKEEQQLYRVEEENKEDMMYEEMGEFDKEWIGVVYDDIEEDEEDEEDFWDEEYEEKFCGALKAVDELQTFKETMAMIQNNSPDYYQQILALVPERTINRISGFLERTLMFTAQKK